MREIRFQTDALPRVEVRCPITVDVEIHPRGTVANLDIAAESLYRRSANGADITQDRNSCERSHYYPFHTRGRQSSAVGHTAGRKYYPFKRAGLTQLPQRLQDLLRRKRLRRHLDIERLQGIVDRVHDRG